MFNNHPMKLHMNPDNKDLSRLEYKVTDFEVWSESNMMEGIIETKERISMNGKYTKMIKRRIEFL